MNQELKLDDITAAFHPDIVAKLKDKFLYYTVSNHLFSTFRQLEAVTNLTVTDCDGPCNTLIHQETQEKLYLWAGKINCIDCTYGVFMSNDYFRMNAVTAITEFVTESSDYPAFYQQNTVYALDHIGNKIFYRMRPAGEQVVIDHLDIRLLQQIVTEIEIHTKNQKHGNNHFRSR